jgi:hypothetical protein
MDTLCIYSAIGTEGTNWVASEVNFIFKTINVVVQVITVLVLLIKRM